MLYSWSGRVTDFSSCSSEIRTDLTFIYLAEFTQMSAIGI